MRSGLGGVALGALVSLACGRLKPAAADGGSSVPTPAATVPTADARPAVAPPADATAPADVPPALDTAVPRAGRELPAGVHPPVRFADGSALLMGNGPDACTHQTPPSSDGHRWCAFTLGAAVGGVADLWVLDVTRAATGDAPRCDGTDPGCIHLTDRVVTHSATLFDGDTLIFGTDSLSGSSPDFLGRFNAWRPGWSTGRQISSEMGFTCIGNRHSAAAACLDDPAGTSSERDSANVRVGYLARETGDPLPSLGRYPLRNGSDVHWQADLSPDGSVFALSDADTVGAAQTLRVAPTSTIGQAAPSLAIDDVFEWQISNDGQRIYFLRGPSQKADLYVADFPSGANARLVDAGVNMFRLLGDRPEDQAVEIWKIPPTAAGAIELLTDLGAAPKTIFSYNDFLNGAIVSPDLRYTTWLDEEFRGVLLRNSDLQACTIGEGGDNREVYDPAYLDASGLMFWKERAGADPNSDFRDGFFARPETCTQKTRFARNVDRIAPIGDRGVVFTDEMDMTARATLKYVAVAPGGATLDPAGPVRVQESVLAPFVLVGDNPPLLVYAAKGATAETSGLFVFGPVPF
ncbi:MAG TPA: hypothetical protein VHL80_17560 [Polyangia bacterium]|nr:hypothetical protein [Polyangia bacterium]